MKIVSWNCNGAFRRKYKELFNAFPDADVFVVQECENPAFYNDTEYRAIFQTGFHAGTPDYYTKGIGVFSRKMLWVRRTKCKYADTVMMMGYAPFEVGGKTNILAVWPHGKYVEEMIDFLKLNEGILTNDMLIIGDTNSNTVFNNHHPVGKNHDVLVELLNEKGLDDAYNYMTGEKEGEETVPTFYIYRYLSQPFHLDRAFTSAARLKRFAVASDRDYWLTLSDHIPIEAEIDTAAEEGILF